MQQLNEQLFSNVVDDSKIPIRIAYIKPDGTPNIISLWYEQIDGKIYCATQKTAKIVSYLEQNPNCGFEIATDKPPYKGSRGNGVAKIIESDGEKILLLLMKKYLGDKPSTLSRYLKNNMKSEVAIEITPKKVFNYDYSKRMKDV
ncbi:MAG: pyridoxamine 5'-phosphate oxidase family protein [Nitrosopumilus sp.]|nr:pyridoxamine 5'-phosphate oxidase family protein [Nitrosopumilus sp.]